mmetsp:Transcript_19889/g.29425  ORF Transcript_19889/g.29425 Transcript_19889/m.29425 type:complete len:217 (+) Transcript_19889:444-1094(+)
MPSKFFPYNVSDSLDRTTASFVGKANGLSLLTANRDPIAMASAPRLKAADRPEPLANPPAATIGASGKALANDGTRTNEVTSPPCAAASWPVHIRASAPEVRAASACLEFVTVARTWPPYSCTASAIQSGFPKLTLTRGTCSSMATLAFSDAPGMSKVAPIPKGLPGANFLILRMDSLVSSADNGPVARMPHPPAFDTAATNSGVDIHDMPGRSTG